MGDRDFINRSLHKIIIVFKCSNVNLNIKFHVPWEKVCIGMSMLELSNGS